MTDEDKRPWEKVTDENYFRRVLGSLSDAGYGRGNSESACLRFGNTGGGHSPHYQIETPEGDKLCLKGSNHEVASDVADEFDPKNLSDQQFSYSDVQDMLDQIRN